ncbi:hypothetical protein MMC25_000151 [Agyrium rufum]|nr:hypothetical protein [Agyrium rufum]
MTLPMYNQRTDNLYDDALRFQNFPTAAKHRPRSVTDEMFYLLQRPRELFRRDRSAQSRPHRVVLIADPQLVDPHTYPDRPWPLSSLTVSHTDLYLSRAYSEILSTLDPQSIFFLGDLFDGGREWATLSSTSPEEQYKKYKDKYWEDEYDRFNRIFTDRWTSRVGSKSIRPLQKFITSLPGNHDLGFGNGIRLSVRKRFQIHFGHGNRVEVIGNHTFVSVDTVSFSAKTQNELDIDTEQHSDAKPLNVDVWKPTDDFLTGVKGMKKRATARELRLLSGKEGQPLMNQSIIDINSPLLRAKHTESEAATDLPSVLLTHVPLFRAPGTPCGPLRERWPPSQQARQADDTVTQDFPNAIQIAAGYQYQNVLQQSLSTELVDRIGNVEGVFSGDDHDYCEVIHRGYTSKGGGIREITVKSISWAMGVRKPGFLLVSLWNPIDENGSSIAGSGSGSTMQTHLCLLPDQLGIFLRYLLMFAFTISVIISRAVWSTFGQEKSVGTISAGYGAHEEDASNANFESKSRGREKPYSDSSSLDAMESSHTNNLAARSAGARTRSTSPNSGYGLPVLQSTSEKYPIPRSYAGKGAVATAFDSAADKFGRRASQSTVCYDMMRDLAFIATPSILLYLWLLRST